MRTLFALAFALSAAWLMATSPAFSEERACRPSLSNFYHCPGKEAAPAPKAERSTARACRRSLSNGYHCPGDPTTTTEEPPPRPSRRQSSSTSDRECRPSLSNGFSCSHAPAATEAPTKANEYQTEAEARVHCFGGTVVWLNIHSGIYHFQGTRDYGNTKRGAYMCESDAMAQGTRAAKNEKHPQ